MTSIKQIEANRRNALRSTGPTEAGKQRSRCNAVRHGLTAETVIGTLEDSDDYRGFEAAIVADYEAQSAVERELLLRLASLLWRLRRATAIETGLFEIHADYHDGLEKACHADPTIGDNIVATSGQGALENVNKNRAAMITAPEAMVSTNPKSSGLVVDRVSALAKCFLYLSALPQCTFDRLNRYEIALWRQVGQTLYALDALERWKPQERKR
jgi:hypothetical protein